MSYNLIPNEIITLILSLTTLASLVPHLATQVRVRTRRRTAPVWLTRSIGALGTTLLLTSPASAAQRKDDRPLRPVEVGPVQPWSEAGGNPPPPPPPVRTEVPFSSGPAKMDTAARVPGTDTDAAQDRSRSRGLQPSGDGENRSPSKSPASHVPRAVHPSTTSPQTIPLFPRVGRDEKTARRACMGRHPSSTKVRREGRYQVRPGDTLWDIAAEVLGTDSPTRIARYWPKIHRANRATIGGNPDLLQPGTFLELPSEERA